MSSSKYFFNTFQEKTYNALLTIGVPRTTLNKVIDILTTGAKPNNNKGQVVVSASDMEFDGTTLKTVDKSSGVERSHPAAYAELPNGATASATVNITDGGSKTIYAYIGHDSSSSSLKVNSSINISVDGTEVTIPAISFADAGMGKCGTRMNYYFVKLGTCDMSSGEHEIIVSGIANKMNLANISVF